MIRSPLAAPLLALIAPLMLYSGALVSQFGFGLFPCEMCYWQRWPHQAAILLAIAALLLRGNPSISRPLTFAAAAAIAISGLIGIYHAGVEYGLWEGLTTCATGGDGGPVSLDAIMNAPLIRCDKAQWTLAGISLAGFNAIFSISAAAWIWALLARQPRAGA